MRLSAHYQLYRENPEGYRNLTRAVFLRLEPFRDLYARVEFLQGDEVAIDLLVKGSGKGRFIPLNDRSRHRITSLDEDPDLTDIITRREGDQPRARYSLERLQEALIEELILG